MIYNIASWTLFLAGSFNLSIMFFFGKPYTRKKYRLMSYYGSIALLGAVALYLKVS